MKSKKKTIMAIGAAALLIVIAAVVLHIVRADDTNAPTEAVPITPEKAQSVGDMRRAVIDNEILEQSRTKIDTLLSEIKDVHIDNDNLLSNIRSACLLSFRLEKWMDEGVENTDKEKFKQYVSTVSLYLTDIDNVDENYSNSYRPWRSEARVSLDRVRAWMLGWLPTHSESLPLPNTSLSETEKESTATVSDGKAEQSPTDPSSRPTTTGTNSGITGASSDTPHNTVMLLLSIILSVVGVILVILIYFIIKERKHTDTPPQADKPNDKKKKNEKENDKATENETEYNEVDEEKERKLNEIYKNVEEIPQILKDIQNIKERMKDDQILNDLNSLEKEVRTLKEEVQTLKPPSVEVTEEKNIPSNPPESVALSVVEDNHPDSPEDTFIARLKDDFNNAVDTVNLNKFKDKYKPRGCKINKHTNGTFGIYEEETDSDWAFWAVTSSDHDEKLYVIPSLIKMRTERKYTDNFIGGGLEKLFESWNNNPEMWHLDMPAVFYKNSNVPHQKGKLC